MARQPRYLCSIQHQVKATIVWLFEKEAPKTVANFVELAEGKREWTHPVGGRRKAGTSSMTERSSIA